MAKLSDELEQQLRELSRFIEKNTPYEQGIGSVGAPMARHVERTVRSLLAEAIDAAERAIMERAAHLRLFHKS